MDINYHYFAVKTLARCAGFGDGDAQQIAEYSQFVDDYNWSFHRNCMNIPAQIKTSDELDLYNVSKSGNFLPNQTGFADMYHFALLLDAKNQRLVVSPLHLSPRDKHLAGDKNVRVVPAKFADGSLIDKMLQAAIAQKEPNNIHLMRIGTLLHTFSDTYAHQMFNGFNSWVNKVRVKKVVSNITKNDITDEILNEAASDHRAAIDAMGGPPQAELDGAADSIVPAIAHAQAGHIPDLSHVSFEMEYKTDAKSKGYDGRHSRNNTETFTECSRHVLDYIRACMAKPPVPDNEWADIAPRLEKGLLVKMPKIERRKTLTAHWSRIFPEVEYRYDKHSVEKRFYIAKENIAELDRVGAAKAYSDEFYEFNVTGNRLLVEMYGSKPRS